MREVNYEGGDDTADNDCDMGDVMVDNQVPAMMSSIPTSTDLKPSSLKLPGVYLIQYSMLNMATSSRSWREKYSI